MDEGLRNGKSAEQLALAELLLSYGVDIEAEYAAELPAQKEAIVTLAQLMSPMTPHLAEDIWQRQGGNGLIAHAAWPEFDETMLVEATVTLPVQVNGKRRSEIIISKDLDKPEIEKLALMEEAVIRALDGEDPKKVIVVPGRLVNIVAN